MEPEKAFSAESVKQLADILKRHGLTRIEYEGADARIVLEKEPPHLSPPAPAFANAVMAIPAGAPPTALVGAGGATDAIAKTGTAASAGAVASADVDLSASSITVVRAPLVGMAYRSKEPGAAPFVNVGDTVERGTVVCLIEAMKMFNEIKAPCDGTVQAVHYEDGALVEHGAPLISLA
ncbi:MAG: acetyl-CoA carboxylase, biotin carboxyl carrier protein [Coriobacteriales bacterium]|jgi:acetyl-CoA carboxylase biotin carboxyl carrier protein|nr:acetyl-CoA carboxylase, biotin carboxyl carrier protein [Coriobacteriales bacterium]